MDALAPEDGGFYTLLFEERDHRPTTASDDVSAASEASVSDPLAESGPRFMAEVMLRTA